MYDTLKIPTPKPSAKIKQQLLKPIQTLSDQFAAIALRAWWDLNTEDDLAHHGLRVWRSHIRAQNSDISALPIPLMLLQEAKHGEHEIALAIFSDSSAIVLRSETVFTGNPDNHDRFKVLPIALKLSSSFRPTDDRPNFSLKVRRKRDAKSLPFITIGKGTQSEEWVNLEAGQFCIECGANWEIRQSIQKDILSCARDWADEIDRLPVLHFPEQGHGYASEASLGPVIGQDLGLDPDRPYACPAFLPFSAYSTQEAIAYTTFCQDVAKWMMLHAPAEISSINIAVLGARLSQTCKSATPSFAVHGIIEPNNTPHLKWSSAATQALKTLAKTSQAPIPMDRLVGQTVTRTPTRLVSSFTTETTIAHAYIMRKNLKLSNHMKLALDHRFGCPNWAN